jgi:hypothetical protein
LIDVDDDAALAFGALDNADRLEPDGPIGCAVFARIVADLDRCHEVARQLCLALAVEQFESKGRELAQVVEMRARPSRRA